MIIAIITGPTGIGKTQTVIQLANTFGAEIVNADSRQVYKDVHIGVASPSQEDYNQVPHHLFEFLPLEKSYSVGEYYQDVRALLDSNPDKKFLLVGGTGFYIKAIVSGLSNTPSIDMSIRSQVQTDIQERGLEEVFLEAQGIDPVACAKIPSTDNHRIGRIVEVYRQTGRTWSSFEDEKLPPLSSAPIFVLERPRDILYQRINERVLTMLEEGWLQEVKLLVSQGVDFELPGLNALGYKELGLYLQTRDNGESDFKNQEFEDLIQLISKKTRNYAKRQMTFMRTQLPETTAINLEKSGYFGRILKKIKKNDFF